MNQGAASKTVQKDTGFWCLRHPLFVRWKTILSSIIVTNLSKHAGTLANSMFVYYYFDNLNQVRIKVMSSLRSITLQLAEQSGDVSGLKGLRET